LNITESTLN